MSAVVRFAPALGEWIAQHLGEGQSESALAQAMQERGIARDAARAIVEAFARARRDGTAAPVDAVELPQEPSPADASGAQDAAVAYRYETPRLAAGHAIRTADRTVHIAARAQRPALAVLGDVLSVDECRQLIAMARPRLAPSTVVDPATGRNVAAPWRASSGMFFRPFENALIARLDRRLAQVMNLPPEHGEGLQVLHYPQGAGSAPHYDFLVPSNEANRASIARSGQRVSTLVAYLNDVPAGGETVFPEAGWAVSPRRGNAVYFEYCNSLGQVDHASLHAGNPVESGEKWVATKWMRARSFAASTASH